MKDHILDKPEERRLFGMDLFINRYHIINPDRDQLLIRQLRSKNYLWVVQTIILFALVCGGIFIAYLYYDQQHEIGIVGFIMFGMASILIWGIVQILVKTFSQKANWHFYGDRLIKTDDYGFKKTIHRNHIKSVFIRETKTYTNGMYSGSDYDVVLKHERMKKGYKLLEVEQRSENQDSLKAALRSKGNDRTSEAYQISKIIADFWKIPVSI